MRELTIISSRIFIKLSDISGVGDTYLYPKLQDYGYAKLFKSYKVLFFCIKTELFSDAVQEL